MTSDKRTRPERSKRNPRKLLYVTNCVDDSEDALAFASTLAKANGAHLELLHVIDPGHSPSMPDAQMEIQFRLETLARSLKYLNSDADALLLYGAPEDVILRRATEIRPALIAIPLNGSVTDVSTLRLVRRLTRRCPFPILPLLPGNEEEECARAQSLDGLAAFIAQGWQGKWSRFRGRPGPLAASRVPMRFAMMSEPT